MPSLAAEYRPRSLNQGRAMVALNSGLCAPLTRCASKCEHGQGKHNQARRISSITVRLSTFFVSSRISISLRFVLRSSVVSSVRPFMRFEQYAPRCGAENQKAWPKQKRELLGLEGVYGLRTMPGRDAHASHDVPLALWPRCRGVPEESPAWWQLV